MNRWLGDPQFRDLLDQARLTVRELVDLEPRVVDGSASEEEWTEAWSQYSGLISRLGHLQQRLLRRRIELMPD
jgi:hypothetical protein